MAFDTFRAPQTELLEDCVHCGFCLDTCPTYVLWGNEADSPRGRIVLIGEGLRTDEPMSDEMVTHFDRCLGCMACVSSCPSGVRYDRLIEATRHTIESEFPRTACERLVRGLLFRLLPSPKRMGVALRLAPLGRFAPMPAQMRPLVEIAPPWRSAEAPERVTPARGEPRGRVGILTGCVQSAVFGSVNTATARVLAADGFEVA